MFNFIFLIFQLNLMVNSLVSGAEYQTSIVTKVETSYYETSSYETATVTSCPGILTSLFDEEESAYYSVVNTCAPDWTYSTLYTETSTTTTTTIVIPVTSEVWVDY